VRSPYLFFTFSRELLKLAGFVRNNISGDIVKHDALFKKLLKNRSVLRAFFEEFFPRISQFIDFNSIEYLDTERFTLEGKKRTGDLVLKTSFRGEATCFLIHLEHQAQRDLELAWRLLIYMGLDRLEYGMPVYPVAVLSYDETSPENLCPLTAEFPNKRILQFDFDVLDLKRLKAREFVARQNIAALALAARMRIQPEEKMRIVRDFFISLASTEAGDAEKELVSGFFSAYQPLTRKEGLQLNRQLGKLEAETKEKVMRLTNPFIELGIQKGMREGMREGRREGIREGRREGALVGRRAGEVDLVLRLIQRRVGILPLSQKKAIRKLALEKIEALGESLLEFESRADLSRWLKQNAA
jgi:hypothetical protein